MVKKTLQAKDYFQILFLHICDIIWIPILIIHISKIIPRTSEDTGSSIY